MHLFDPLRGGKWRAALTTISAIFAALVADHVISGPWTGTVVSILAAINVGVQGTTHLTDVGNETVEPVRAGPTTLIVRAAHPTAAPVPVPVAPLAPDAPPEPPAEPTDGTSGDVEPA